MPRILPPPSLLLLRFSLRQKQIPRSSLAFYQSTHYLRPYVTLNGITDQRDPDLPPGPPSKGNLSALPASEKTPDFQVPWFMNGPRLDMSKYKYPLRYQDGKETVHNVFLKIPLFENIFRFGLHSLTRIMIVEMTNLLTYPNYLRNGFHPGAQHACTVLFKALSEKDRNTLTKICTPQLYELLQQSLDRLDSQNSDAKLSIQTVFGMKLNDIWMKYGHPQLFLARPSRNLRVHKTMTITVGKMVEPVEDEKSDPPGILHQMSIDVQVLAHVTRSLTCLPTNLDNPKSQREPVTVLDDEGPREFVLTFKSSPVPRRVGTGGNDDEEGYRTASELMWKISDIDYILASEEKPDVTVS